MSNFSRATCVVTLLLILGSIAMPVYSAGVACIGMPCHADRSDKVGEPMSHDCCGTAICVDAPPATTSEAKVTVAPLQQTVVLLVASVKIDGVSAVRRAASVGHSPPRETSSRLALLATLLI